MTGFSNSINSRKLLRKTFQDNIELFCLMEVRARPTYGYEIMSHIRKAFGVYISPSIVYPALNKLERQGHLTSARTITEGNKLRKTYQLTKSGEFEVKALSLTFGVIAHTFGGFVNAKEQVTS